MGKIWKLSKSGQEKFIWSNAIIDDIIALMKP